MKDLTIQEIIARIQPADRQAMQEAKEHWRHIGKPLYSLGKLEDAVIRLAGIRKTADVQLKKRRLVIMCADNGVVKEGVSQTGQEVTATVTGNFKKGVSTVALMAGMADCEVVPVDIGVAVDVEGVTVPEDKVSYGTEDFLLQPAMTREEALKAINIGIRKAEQAKIDGMDILLTGEMGIGNTTTSSAVLSVMLKRSVEEMTGYGAGLSDEGLLRKIRVIKEGIEKHQPDNTDPVDVLRKVGGLDIAGLMGLCLGGAIYHIPVLLDGLITGAAAVLAVSLCPLVKEYLFASHVSKEKAGMAVLDALGLSPLIIADMCVGEGSGAVAALPLLDMGLLVYQKMATFDDIRVEEYEDFKA